MAREAAFLDLLFELDRCVKYFDADARFDYLFGDIVHEPEAPAFVKSRPITSGATNSVVLKLDRIRHFNFISDPKAFADKKEMLVSRNVVRQPHRRLLLEKYFGHPLCDLGQVNTDTDHPGMDHPLHDHEPAARLQVHSLHRRQRRGHQPQVGDELQLHSGDACAPLRDLVHGRFADTRSPLHRGSTDYSDLATKLQHYIDHPDEAQAIIDNAHSYVDRFRNRRIERAAGLLVVKKYLELTGQLTES